MNAKRFVTLTLLLILSTVCVRFTMGSSVIVEPFSAHIKRAELIFIGTLVDKHIFLSNVASGSFETDLTFHVDKRIEGTPNIDKDTVKFSLPTGHRNRNSMAQGLRNLEVGDTLMMLMRFNPYIAPRYKGLYTASIGSYWFVKTKKVNKKTEYTVYIWANTKERLKQLFLELPLSLVVRLIKSARKHPKRIDRVTDIMSDAIMEGISRGVKPDTREAQRIHQRVITFVERALDILDDKEDDKPEESKG